MTTPPEASRPVPPVGGAPGGPSTSPACLIGSAVLVNHVTDTDAAATVVDCLFLAQPTTPDPTNFVGWSKHFADVLTNIGWVQTDSSTSTDPLSATPAPPSESVPGSAAVSSAGHPAPTTIPWSVLSPRLPGVAATPLTPALASIARLPHLQLNQWNSQTVFGGQALAVTAAAFQTADECTLIAAVGWLTRTTPVTASPAPYPVTPVPDTNASLTVQCTTFTCPTATLASLRSQLDPPVAPVLASLIALPC